MLRATRRKMETATASGTMPGRLQKSKVKDRIVPLSPQAGNKSLSTLGVGDSFPQNQPSMSYLREVAQSTLRTEMGKMTGSRETRDAESHGLQSKELDELSIW